MRRGYFVAGLGATQFALVGRRRPPARGTRAAGARSGADARARRDRSRESLGRGAALAALGRVGRCRAAAARGRRAGGLAGRGAARLDRPDGNEPPDLSPRRRARARGGGARPRAGSGAARGDGTPARGSRRQGGRSRPSRIPSRAAPRRGRLSLGLPRLSQAPVGASGKLTAYGGAGPRAGFPGSVRPEASSLASSASSMGRAR